MYRLFSYSRKVLLDILFPVFCAGCGEEGAYLCGLCASSLKQVPPSCFVCKKITPVTENTPPVGETCLGCRSKTKIQAFFSPFVYYDEFKIKKLIHSFKYKRAKTVGEVLSDLLAGYFMKYGIIFPENTVIIPTPLHKSRYRERGFNQSEIIGQHLSDRFSIKMEKNLLFKIQKTKSQMELAGEERKQNILGVFAVKNQDLIKNKTILLIDDVKTTGATLEEAACVLKKAGAHRIWATTIAH